MAAAADARIIINHSDGERAFPLGGYSKVSDKRGSIGHSIRRLRLMPGLNNLDNVVVGQERVDVAAADLDAVLKHPAMKRLIDQGVIALYKSPVEIPKREKMQIAAQTIDMDVLEAWLKTEGDEHVRVELRKQIKALTDQGLHEDDRHISNAPMRLGQTPRF